MSDVEIPLVDGNTWYPPPVLLEGWHKAYPSMNVEAELAKMRVWTLANPKNRKTIRGIARAANTWLSKANDNSSRPAWNNGKPEPRQRREDAPDMLRHWWALLRIIDARQAGMLPDDDGATYRFSLVDLVDAAIAREAKQEWSSPAARWSAIRGGIWASLNQKWGS